MLLQFGDEIKPHSHVIFNQFACVKKTLNQIKRLGLLLYGASAWISQRTLKKFRLRLQCRSTIQMKIVLTKTKICLTYHQTELFVVGIVTALEFVSVIVEEVFRLWLTYFWLEGMVSSALRIFTSYNVNASAGVHKCSQICDRNRRSGLQNLINFFSCNPR